MTDLPFAGAATRLAPNDVAAAAQAMGCAPAALAAVCAVESAGGGFLPDRRPKILFEAHVFGRLTGHRWDSSHPGLSAPAWNRALYGAAGAHQYERLEAAAALDRDSALRATSWGLFQILGLNHAACGFVTTADLVLAMCRSERAQLDAFAAFCHSGGLTPLLARRDWQGFAQRYNGAAQSRNDYAGRLAAAYQQAVQPPRHSAAG